MRKFSYAAVILLAGAFLLSGCAASPPDCTQPEVFCVGLVTQLGKRNDHSYNQASWEGLQQAKDKSTADWVAYIETVDARDYAVNIRVFAEAGYDLVVTVGDVMSDATYTAALQYPETYFIGVNQPRSEAVETIPNLVWLIFPEDQLGFLAGALASMMSQTDKIGAVCATDASTPIQQCCEGYRIGAAYINPDTEVTVIYHNEVDFGRSFTDPDWGAATANSLIDNGADIIFGVGGTTGSNAIVTAATRGAYGIGADVDQYYLLPIASSRILTSILKVIPPALDDLIRAARDAQAQTGAFPAGDYNGPVGVAPYHDLESLVPEQVKQRLTDLVQALASGNLESAVPVPTTAP
jgi:basic membrane protein A